MTTRSRIPTNPINCWQPTPEKVQAQIDRKFLRKREPEDELRCSYNKASLHAITTFAPTHMPRATTRSS